MAKRKKYMNNEFIVGVIALTMLYTILSPLMLLYLLLASGSVGFLFYLKAFYKYRRNFFKPKDHILIISLIKYWKLKYKIILGSLILFTTFYLNHLINNPFIDILYNSLLISAFITALILGIRKLVLKMKAFLQNDHKYVPLATIDDVDQMSGKDFEHFLLPIYMSQGYSGEVTRSSGDFGADLILRGFKEVVVVQAKRYDILRKVGISAVNEVVGAAGYYNATKKIVITNSTFTDAAIQTAIRNQVILLDRGDLIKLIKEYNDVKFKLLSRINNHHKEYRF
uniref:restriction endonuclease n=1 Tax=uncultured Allobacillus sp. TaxID=1638025 RepID=UPI002598D1B4|nr:restriction endonuclease [uncultured Allobacillus sp.]